MAIQRNNERQKSELDSLFENVGLYRKSSDYMGLLNFVKKFPMLAPYNAFLLHVQKPGSVYVETESGWRKYHNRTVKTGARPLVLLKPFGPVKFVYDISDTEGPEDERYNSLLHPFDAKIIEDPGRIWEMTDELRTRIKADGILCTGVATFGSGCAGMIKVEKDDHPSYLSYGKFTIKHKYSIQLNSVCDLGTQVATLLHELGHLYCGHLGSPDTNRWPSRTGLSTNEKEFEAESVSWLICRRMGIRNPSEKYLSMYVENNSTIPNISIDAVLKAVGLIEDRMYHWVSPCKLLVLK